MNNFKSYIQNQLKFGKGDPKGRDFSYANRTAIHENVWDVLSNDMVYPGLSIGARAGALGAAGYAASFYLGQGTAVGGAIGGALIGGMAGGIGLNFVGKTLAEGAEAGIAAGLHTGIDLQAKKITAKLIRGGAGTVGALGGALLGAGIGGLGFVPTLGLAAAGIFGTGAILSAGAIGAGGALRSIGGAGGIIKGIPAVGMAAGKAAWTGVRGVEYAARTILTGGKHGVASNPLDAWFPFFRSEPFKTTIGDLDHVDDVIKGRLMSRGVAEAEAKAQATIKAGTTIYNPRKFAPNPRIIRRAIGISALFSLGAGISEAIKPQIAPPSAYFDGRYMRHVNDMGTGGGYGMGVMGRNSGLNLTNQDASRIISQMF